MQLISKLMRFNNNNNKRIIHIGWAIWITPSSLSFSPNSSETNLKILTPLTMCWDVKQCSQCLPPRKKDVIAALVRIGKTTSWVILWVLWVSSSTGNSICKCNTHFQFLLRVSFSSSIFYCFTVEGIKCWGRYKGGVAFRLMCKLVS